MPFLTGPELRTNYQMLGPALHRDSTPVALIHGLGANLAFWYLGAAPHLGQSHSLLMHDLRGHGASSMPATGYDLGHLAQDFGDLLDSLGIGRAHVVGHSHGARVALAFALGHPDRVASLTLADTQLRALQDPMRLRDWPHWPRWKADLARQGVTSFPPDEAEIDFRVLAALGPRGRSPVARPGALRLTGAQIGTQFGAPIGARLRAAREQGPLPPQPAGAMGGAAAPARIDLRSRQMGARSSEKWQKLLTQTSAATDLDCEAPITAARLPDLAMPVLLMYGEVSHCVPTSDRLLEILPDARRILVPEAGHFFPLVKPRPFARALRMFVARVESEGTPGRHRLMARVMAARAIRRRQGGGS